MLSSYPQTMKGEQLGVEPNTLLIQASKSSFDPEFQIEVLMRALRAAQRPPKLRATSTATREGTRRLRCGLCCSSYQNGPKKEVMDSFYRHK